jgi:hypothetical protein
VHAAVLLLGDGRQPNTGVAPASAERRLPDNVGQMPASKPWLCHFGRSSAGLTVREIARTAGLPTATVGDYFSGRHLPQVKLVGMFTRILVACGVVDPETIRQWHVALRRARRAAPR